MPSEYFLKRMAEIKADPSQRTAIGKRPDPDPLPPEPPVMSAEDALKGPIDWPVFQPDAPAKESHPYFMPDYEPDLRRSGVQKKDDGFIYFITDADFTIVKIGRAANPNARLVELQTGNHLKLKLSHCFRADMNAEKLFHQKFAHLRRQGEWFEYTYDLEVFEDDEFDFRVQHLVGKYEPLNMAQVSFLLDILNCDDSDAYLTRLFEYLETEKARGVPVNNDWINR